MVGNLLNTDKTKKMKNLFLYSILSVWIAFGMISCSGDADMNKPQGNNAIPMKIDVSTIKITNQSGRSIIRYTRPDDLNLKYVRAVYEVNGVVRKVNASYYTDSLIIDGFPDAGEYAVKLYSVNYAEGVSEPVPVIINPDIPPYQNIQKTFLFDETFGGFRILANNPTSAPISIGVLRMDTVKNEKGEPNYKNGELEMAWKEIDMIYTSLHTIIQSERGQLATRTLFGMYVKDRWGHVSDTAQQYLTPWEEIKCDKSKFKSYPLPTDWSKQHSWGGSNTKIEALWDEANITSDSSPCFHTGTDAPMPQWFTIDLGRVYELSRFVFQHRGNATSATMMKYLFQNGYPKKIRLWGCENTPNAEGTFDGWVNLLATDVNPTGYIDIKRPSGETQDGGAVALTEDDKKIAAGYEIEFPIGTKFRYFRFETASNWAKSKWVQLGEFTFYGALPKDN